MKMGPLCLPILGFSWSPCLVYQDCILLFLGLSLRFDPKSSAFGPSLSRAIFFFKECFDAAAL